MKKSRPRLIKWLLAIFGLVLAAGILFGIQWATYARPPLPEPIQALESSEEIQITEEHFYLPTPDRPVELSFLSLNPL